MIYLIAILDKDNNFTDKFISFPLAQMPTIKKKLLLENNYQIVAQRLGDESILCAKKKIIKRIEQGLPVPSTMREVWIEYGEFSRGISGKFTDSKSVAKLRSLCDKCGKLVSRITYEYLHQNQETCLTTSPEYSAYLYRQTLLTRQKKSNGEPINYYVRVKDRADYIDEAQCPKCGTILSGWHLSRGHCKVCKPPYKYQKKSKL